jgi:hypothetical protein
MGDDSFKGTVKIEHPEDKNTKVEVTYRAETDKDGQMTVTLKVEGERAVQTHTIREAMEEDDRKKKDARRKLQQDTEKAIQNLAEDIINNRQKSSDKSFKTMNDYIKG